MSKIMSSKNGEYPAIAIDGGGGAGKTTFASKLCEYLEGFTLFHGDDYYDPYPNAGAPTPGFFNADRLMHDIGPQLAAGERKLSYRPYDWTVGRIVTRETVVNQGVIQEGVRTLDLPIPWDVRIWVDAPPEDRKRRFVYERSDDKRRIKGCSPAELGDRFEFWEAKTEEYLKKLNLATNVDCVVNGLASFEDQAADVLPHISRYLED